MQEYLEQIVCLINDNYRAQALTSAELRNCRAFGISQPVTRTKEGKTETLPMVKKNDELLYCGPEDTANLIFYHKNNGSTFSTVPKTGYGRSSGFQKDVTSMSIIVFGLARQINKTALELRDIFNSKLLLRLTKAQRTGIGLISANIIGAAADMNMIQVLRRELPQSDYILNEGHIYFEFKYQVEAMLKPQQCTTC